jgi:hypothetical protein
MKTKPQALDGLLDENSDVVFDTGVFNLLRRNGGVVRQLEEESYSVLKRTSRKQVAPSLIKNLLKETKFLSDLARKIRSSKNYFTTPGVVEELENYYLKVCKTDEVFLRNPDSLLLPYVSKFLSSLGDAICTCRGYCQDRAETFWSENQKLFESYFNWLTDHRVYSFKSPDGPSQTDLGVVAFSLTLANERPVQLFTTDAKDVLEAVRNFYGSLNQDKINTGIIYLEPPRNPVRVYTGLGEGWKLSMDSEKIGV